ncbi:hypothetical protein CRE_26258 [Caenorhabditis remanei]|uniref:G-protein coupled receptors family 1 profile domain-containing protein n=1 Tax=Caenorhabditis remanei TaxID=31234 RepID=E3LR10_CAERE|nr:hypothetical protein CRE_26258 [Caenorhabditis remanei]
MSNSSPNPVDPSCASEDLLNALTSPLMIFNHFFILSVIFAGFVVSRFAIRKLLNQNVFPTCTKILLLTSVINGIIHQGITAVIRVRTVVRAIRFANDPCSILFLTADCFVDGIVYYHTNLFSSIVCISLFLDRLLSSNPRSFYNSFQTTATVIFIILQIGIPILLIYWIFYDSAYTSYVAMCNYPTATASVKFFYVTSTRLYVLGFVLVISVILFIKNSKKEKQMVHNVYDTESRYNTYENYLATKAICWVIFSQVVCLLSTSFIRKL